jgi:hypothetical protein
MADILKPGTIRCGSDNYIGAEPTDVKPPLRVYCLQVIQRSKRAQTKILKN